MRIKHFIKGTEGLTAKQKHSREIFLYIIFGGLTTLVNFIAFVLIDKLLIDWSLILPLPWGSSFDLKVILNTVISWILAVLFAFATNRTFVFMSKGPIFKELIGFVSSRIATLLLFEIGFFQLSILVLEQGLHISKDQVWLTLGGFTITYLYVLKLLVAFFVVAGNYILSKIFVFRHKKQEE